MDAHDALIRPAISSHIRGGASSLDDLDEEESFTLAARGALGGTALLVYTRDATISARVQSVQIQTAACGVLGLMGNKGGVGARIVLGKSSGSSTAVDGEGDGDRVPLMSAESSIRGDEQEEVLTFVAAHLAAHDSGLERRNSDYRQIVRRLVFPQDSLRGVLSQIYSSSYREWWRLRERLTSWSLTPRHRAVFFAGVRHHKPRSCLSTQVLMSRDSLTGSELQDQRECSSSSVKTGDRQLRSGRRAHIAQA